MLSSARIISILTCNPNRLSNYVSRNSSDQLSPSHSKLEQSPKISRDAVWNALSCHPQPVSFFFYLLSLLWQSFYITPDPIVHVFLVLFPLRSHFSFYLHRNPRRAMSQIPTGLTILLLLFSTLHMDPITLGKIASCTVRILKFYLLYIVLVFGFSNSKSFNFS